MMANDLDKKLRRKDLMKFGYGGFDNLAGPLGRDAVQAGHILEPATLAAVAKVELGGHKIAFTPSMSEPIAQGVRLCWHFLQDSECARNWLKWVFFCCHLLDVKFYNQKSSMLRFNVLSIFLGFGNSHSSGKLAEI